MIHVHHLRTPSPTTQYLSRFLLAIHPLIQTHWRSFLGDIRPRSRRSEPPDKLRCVFAPFGRGCHSAPVLSRAHPCAASRAAQPYDSPSALRHRANNRPKGHSGPLACNHLVIPASQRCFVALFFSSFSFSHRDLKVVLYNRHLALIVFYGNEAFLQVAQGVLGKTGNTLEQKGLESGTAFFLLKG